MIVCAYIALSLMILYSVILFILGIVDGDCGGCLLMIINVVNLIVAIIGIVGIACR